MKANTLTYIAIMLFAALIAGKIVKKMKLPNVTGYLVLGLFIGPNCIGILTEELLDSMSLVTELALGCIAFSIGAEFKISFLKKVGKAPIIIGILEGFGAVFVVDVMLLMIGCDITFALALGAIASATAAASTLMIVKQYKAKGPVTNTLLPVVALDDAVALMVLKYLGYHYGLCRKNIYRQRKPTCNYNYDDLLMCGGIGSGGIFVTACLHDAQHGICKSFKIRG